jgi:plasmid stability protein
VALVKKLHQRAKASGRSAAEEHRQILREALLESGPREGFLAGAGAPLKAQMDLPAMDRSGYHASVFSLAHAPCPTCTSAT